jgi:uncharacterized protein (TIGR02466 family)
LSLRPQLASAWNDRGVSLVALRRDSEAREAFEHALALQPLLSAASSNLGNLALRARDPERAEAFYRAGLRTDVRHVAARIGLGRALLQRARLSEARTELEHALRQAPTCFDALLALVGLELEAERPLSALESCEHFLQMSPQHSGAWGIWAELARERGDAKALALLDLDRWVEVQDLPLDGAFQAELSEVLLAQRSLLDAPPHHATRLGRHSGALTGLEHGSIARLESYIEQAVGRFIAARATVEPWSRAPASAVALHMWAVALTSEGCQVPHLHPDAWVSGVYYVAVPESLEVATTPHAGDLEFGRPDPELRFAPLRSSHYVKPKAGRLVLFPSWLYHSTIPHGASGLRISLAFDCVRVHAGAQNR